MAEADVGRAEAALQLLCATVQQCVSELPGLEGDGAAADNPASEGADALAAPVTYNSLLASLGVLESVAVRVARLHLGVLQAEVDAEAAARAAAEAAEAAAQGKEADIAPVVRPLAARLTHPAPASPGASVPQRRKRQSALDSLVGRALPSMEGIVPTHSKHDDETVVIGMGESKYGRRSLRGELMAQILAGVPMQMEKLEEEETLVRIGEKARDTGSEPPKIDKTKRDAEIDAWLVRRNSLQPKDRRENWGTLSSGSPVGGTGRGPAAKLAAARAAASSPSAHGGACPRISGPPGGEDAAVDDDSRSPRAPIPATGSAVSPRDGPGSAPRSRLDASRGPAAAAPKLPQVAPTSAARAAAGAGGSPSARLSGSRSMVALGRSGVPAPSAAAAKPRRSRPDSPAASPALPGLLLPDSPQTVPARGARPAAAACSGPGKSLSFSASTPALSMAKAADGSVSELHDKLAALKAERRQIDELKALAMAKSSQRRHATGVQAAYFA